MGCHIFKIHRKLGGGGGVLSYDQEHFKCVELHLSSLQDVQSIPFSVVLSPCMSFALVVLY